jgi:uncharacterized protein (DUF1330 family)
MACYLVVNDRITDPEGIAAYYAAAGPTLAGHTAKVHVASDAAETLEGTPAGSRVVIMEFPDRAALDAWYHSKAYQDIIGLRHGATEGFAVVVDSL